jgi:alkaline phosphatase D
MDRRDFVATFLRGAGCFALASAAPFPPRLHASSAAGRHHFPQGLASGDPTPSTVVLWTRVESTSGSVDPVPLVLQVSPTEDFARVVAEERLIATAATDFTVRVLVEGLSPDTRYHYRFRAGADVTNPPGRTRTAPLPSADRPVRIAFASCQSYEGGYYHAWRTLINDEAAAGPDEQIDFVLHLGDFIYEALGYGSVRPIAGLPSGGGETPGGLAGVHATTLEDYRFLYRTYLADPDLRAARARWPFVTTWDDHEFSDDCWQSVSTYVPAGRPEQARKVAANRAWFEYIPADLSAKPEPGAPPRPAHDFRITEAQDAPLSGRVDDHGLDQEPNNLAAVASLGIARSIRWGRNVELVVTDNRSFRSEHPVPGELNVQISGSARYVTPVALVRALDAGRTAAGGNPPESVSLGARAVPNPRRNSPPGTILGREQKTWFKETVRRSNATWKVWGNSVPLLPLRLDLHHLDPEKGHELAFTTDCWDGYPTERGELLRFLAEHRIPNFVSLTGDHHAHFAGSLAVDFDAEHPRWVGAEFAVAGISSQSVWEGVLAYTPKDSPLRPLTAFDARPFGGTEAATTNLNTTFLWGARAAVAAARTGDLAAAAAERNPRQNRHLAYCDTAGYGIGIARFSASDTRVEFIGIRPPLEPRGEAGGDVLRRVRFVLPLWRSGEEAPMLRAPEVDGPRPFPLT